MTGAEQRRLGENGQVPPDVDPLPVSSTDTELFEQVGGLSSQTPASVTSGNPSPATAASNPTATPQRTFARRISVRRLVVPVPDRKATPVRSRELRVEPDPHGSPRHRRAAAGELDRLPGLSKG